MARKRQRKDPTDYYAIALDYTQRRRRRFAELFPEQGWDSYPTGPLDVPGHVLGFGAWDYHRYRVRPDSSIEQITSRSAR